MRRCREALCLTDCVRHWFWFPRETVPLERMLWCWVWGSATVASCTMVSFILFILTCTILGHIYCTLNIACCDLIVPVQCFWGISSCSCAVCSPCSFLLPVTYPVLWHVIISLKSRFPHGAKGLISNHIVMEWLWLWPNMLNINSISATP